MVDEHMSSLIYGGSASSQILVSFLGSLLEKVEGEDVIAMSKDGAAFVADLKLVCVATMALTSFRFSSASAEDVRELMTSKCSKRPLIESVRTAIAASEFYNAKQASYAEAEVVMVEKEASMESHSAALRAFEACDAKTEEKWTRALMAAHEDLTHVVRFVEQGHFDDFGELLMQATCQHVSAFVDAATKSDELAPRTALVQQMLQSASVAFPLEVTINTLQERVASVASDAKVKHVLNTFVASIEQASQDSFVVSDATVVDGLFAASVQCVGLAMPEGVGRHVDAFVVKSLAHVAQGASPT